MSPDDTCKKYVETLLKVARTANMGAPVEYELLADQGKLMPFKKTELTGTMPLGECFHNAYKAMADTEYMYCEGYAMTEKLGMPMAHGWLMDVDGNVIDPTWKDGYGYFGVVFDTMFMLKFVARTNALGIFGNLYRLKMRPEDCVNYLKKGLVNELPATV